MDFFRKIFGIPSHDNFHRFPKDKSEPNSPPETFFSGSDPPEHEFPRKSFDVFTDPLQMQRYFEQEINEMLKMFGFPRLDDFSSNHLDSPSFEDPRAILQDTPNSSLRDQFLKNGYEKPSSMNLMDQDLDAKVASGDLEAILDGQFDKSTNEYQQPRPNLFYKNSYTMKTKTNPDGSIETHYRTEDNEGTENVTVCHKIREKEYCLIRKRDASGKEDLIEQFTNMDASEKCIFEKFRDPTGTQSKFSFDQFFN